MKRYIGLTVAVIACACLIPAIETPAADVGDQIFPQDLKEKSRAGVIFETIERDVNMTSGPDTLKKVKADAIYLRVNNEIGQTATLDVDIGGLNPEGGDYSYYLGLGLRFLAYDTDQLRGSVFAQIHYSPVDTRSGDVKTDFDYIEGEGGVLLSRKIVMHEQFTLMPYAGPVISVVRLDGSVKDDVAGVKADFDAEEETMVGLAAGLTLAMKENHSLRIELRYFDDLNFSIGAAISFQ